MSREWWLFLILSYVVYFVEQIAGEAHLTAVSLTEYTERNTSESIFYGTEIRNPTCTQDQ